MLFDSQFVVAILSYMMSLLQCRPKLRKDRLALWELR